MCEPWDFYSHLLNYFFFKLSIYFHHYNYNNKEARNIIFLLRKRDVSLKIISILRKKSIFVWENHQASFWNFLRLYYNYILTFFVGFSRVIGRRNGGFEIGIRNPLSRWAEARKCRSTLRTISNSFCEWPSMLSEQTWHIYLCSFSKMRGT